MPCICVSLYRFNIKTVQIFEKITFTFILNQDGKINIDDILSFFVCFPFYV